MNKDLIVFDLDMYRGLYKKSFEIARRYPDLYSEITGKSAGKIMERLSYSSSIISCFKRRIITIDI